MAKGASPAKDTEPIAVTIFNWPAGHPHLGRFGSGEYLTSWFVGQIGEDAVSGFLSTPFSPFLPSDIYEILIVSWRMFIRADNRNG